MLSRIHWLDCWTRVPDLGVQPYLQTLKSKSKPYVLTDNPYSKRAEKDKLVSIWGATWELGMAC